ncbi:hypothetical protein IEE_05450 [Bacillus cereus BAG5X1-1]|uniref:Type III toxin-antitoxin system ToxN/AbiQ family toxin n=1 Tax=Bacillus cereus BAG5X1-1 TaxID=1053189 RepID=J8ABS9_BACCE|nr:hypothetical protein [Bacillus cereus]EJQ36069.1 hypothetical protein IEE_05450 [Bacillus cereus BAG5X1-1]PFE70774.1 hypothetical protein CN316_11400 [Bacillus cereus]
METGDYVKISDRYFKDNPNLKEKLYNKEERRMYIGVVVKLSDQLNVCVPFRTKAPNNNRVVEHGTFSIPSETRPNACLDLTKALIINNESYLCVLQKERVAIPTVQKAKINENIDELDKMLRGYIKGYKKDYKENIRRPERRRDPLYQFSTLQNYHKELGMIKEQEKPIEQDKQRERARRMAYIRQMGRER